MNTKETLKALYKSNVSLEIKNKILRLLIEKIVIVCSSELDFKFETLLNDNKIYPTRYARGYYVAFYKI